MVGRLVIAIAASAVVAASCGGESDGGSAGEKGKALRAEVASYDLASGERTRFIVGLFTSDNRFVSFGEVALRFFFLGEEKASGEPEPGPQATGRYLALPGSNSRRSATPVAVSGSVARGVYAASDVVFDKPGFWEVEVTAHIEGMGQQKASAAFPVLDEHRVPASGDEAPRTKNLTLDSDAPRAAIDSRARGDKKIPDPRLHRTTIARSLKRGEPALVVFSTPVYCVSRFCGPITDMVERLADDYGGSVNFIHVEIWHDFDDSAINKATAQWLFRDQQDLREPWVFLIGRDGRIVARWDNVATREEIEPHLRRLEPGA